MRSRRGGEPETYHLTCPVCGALPGTSCIENYQERERVHPSRKMSVAERNRRAANGWEPPELTERRLRERGAQGAGAPQRSTGAVLDGRAAPAARSHQAPGSTRRPAAAGAGPARDEDVPAPWAGTLPPVTGESSWAWFAAYLGGFPEDTAVPRRQLRDAASVRWPGTEASPLRVTPGRQLHLRVEGRPSSSKGRRSSHHLAGHLKTYEDLGLVRRDHARDVVIVTDPACQRFVTVRSFRHEHDRPADHRYRRRPHLPPPSPPRDSPAPCSRSPERGPGA